MANEFGNQIALIPDTLAKIWRCVYMAVPKFKVSKARTGQRRSQWKLTPLNLVACPQCHELKMPHRVCSECGYYGGKQIVNKDDKK